MLTSSSFRVPFSLRHEDWRVLIQRVNLREPKGTQCMLMKTYDSFKTSYHVFWQIYRICLKLDKIAAHSLSSQLYFYEQGTAVPVSFALCVDVMVARLSQTSYFPLHLIYSWDVKLHWIFYLKWNRSYRLNLLWGSLCKMIHSSNKMNFSFLIRNILFICDKTANHGGSLNLSILFWHESLNRLLQMLQCQIVRSQKTQTTTFWCERKLIINTNLREKWGSLYIVKACKHFKNSMMFCSDSVLLSCYF